jgi:hypothetical protein
MPAAHPQVPRLLRRHLVDPSDDGAADNVLEGLFAECSVLSKGYVEDDRNTDNAWLESTVCASHDEHDMTFALQIKVPPAPH